MKQMQRFDLMAIPVSILFERRSSGGQIIADVRLIDGSKDPRDKGDAPANATIPVTWWFKSNEDLAAFKVHIGRTPLLFMCLTGNLGKDKKVNVAQAFFIASGQQQTQSAISQCLFGLMANLSYPTKKT